MLTKLRGIDPSNILAGVLIAAIGGFVASGFQSAKDTATNSGALAEAKDCRNQLIDARTRELTCWNHCTERALDDIRSRLPHG